MHKRSDADVTDLYNPDVTDLYNSVGMSESPSSEDLELLMREIQALEEENYVLTDAYAAVEASTAGQKAQGEQGEATTPSGGLKVSKSWFIWNI